MKSLKPQQQALREMSELVRKPRTVPNVPSTVVANITDMRARRRLCLSKTQ